MLGSDHPSIIEAYVRRQNEHKKPFPKMMLFQHEVSSNVDYPKSKSFVDRGFQYVAISAADGYARLAGKAQCVLVHVDVGTAALGQGLHNASSGKAPVLIFSGQAPYTLYGEAQGSRSEHVQWYQDVPNQAGLMAPYTRYTNELKSGEHVQMMVNRAIMMATTGSPGPTYLTGTREVLAAAAEPPKEQPMPTCHLGGLPAEDVETIGDALVTAERPLVVTGYLGRNHQAVRTLVELADLIGGLKVFDSEMREMSFPTNHRASVYRSTGARPAVEKADVILVLDADVPWIPTKVRPESAKIFHIDLDPRKEKMNLFDIFAAATYNADSARALRQLCDFVSKRDRSHLSAKAEELEKSHRQGMDLIEKRALPPPDGGLTKDYLFRKMRELVPEDSIFVSDAVTNQIPMSEQLQVKLPGTNFTKGGSGLGWAGGAAIGMKMASRMYDTTDRPNVKKRESDGKFICMVIGDGSFMFSVPSAVYWASYRHNCPFLTIILDNGGWKATRSCINDVHPDGLAAQVSDMGLGIDLRGDGPDYLGIAKAGANGNLWTGKADKAADLEGVLKEAIASVKAGTGAIVDAIIKV